MGLATRAGRPPQTARRRASRDDQAATLAWLSTPASYGPDVGDVVRIDTDGSVVFLAGDRAFKLTRAIRRDDLDYATADLRRGGAAREVRLNRRTAPTLYHGVRAVTREPDGSLALDGVGPAVDWLVEMARFDEAARLDRIADRGALELDLMPALADAVARLHELAEWRFDHGGEAGMAAVVAGNRAGLARQRAGVLVAGACRELCDATETVLAGQGSLLETRRLDGHVRWGHGDLHLGNVCLVEDRPMLFDGMASSPALACGDVLYDLASLLMDLVHRGLPRHASAVFNRYLEATGDLCGLALMPLFLSVRAAERARVSATRASRHPATADRRRLRSAARRYLRLARDMLVSPPAGLVCVGGDPGSGKSTIARVLAADLGGPPGAVVLRSDHVRRRLLGVAPPARLGDADATDGDSRRISRTLAAEAATILRAGRSVVVDADLGDPLDRALLVDQARLSGAIFAGLWLDAPRAVRVDRLARRSRDISHATAAVATSQPGLPERPIGWCRVDASGPVAETVAAARRALADLLPTPTAREQPR